MTTHLIHVPVDMRKFGRWAGERGLVRRGSFDRDFALHVLLAGMFGKAALQPFRLFASERRREAGLYAYSDSDAEQLRSVAGTVAPPDCLAVLDLGPESLRSKPMPAGFEAEQRLGFDLRVRPVRRLRRELPDSRSGKALARGAEVDAFRLEALRRFPHGWKEPEEGAAKAGITREKVYGDWLAERLEGAARIERCRLVVFQRARTVRGDGIGPEGPDATLQGVLTVREPDAFAGLLRAGVGRHRAYGYGMLLLRPPDASPPGR